MEEEKKKKKQYPWEAYALDACQCIVDARMFLSEDEEILKNPLFKRSVEMAAKALEIWKKGEEK